MNRLLTADEWGRLHGLEGSWVRRLAGQGRIEGAQKIGRQWVIPEDAPAPEDARVRSGAYKNWRKPKTE